MKTLRIVAFGDSLTEGSALTKGETNWTDILAERFPFTFVLNAGIGGNTTGEALERMERDVLSVSPDIVIINFGMNDHVICDADGRARTFLNDFRENLCTMVTSSRTIGAFPVLATPNRIIEEYYYERHPREWYLTSGGAQAQLAAYCDCIREIADAYTVPLADIHRQCEKYSLPTLLRTPEQGNFRDGVHPYGAGILLYADTISEILSKDVFPILPYTDTI